jgi:hypothetical protein
MAFDSASGPMFWPGTGWHDKGFQAVAHGTLCALADSHIEISDYVT